MKTDLAAIVQVWHGRRTTTTRSASLLVRDPPHRLAQAPSLRAECGEARGHPLRRGVAVPRGHLPERGAQVQALPHADMGAAPGTTTVSA